MNSGFPPPDAEPPPLADHPPQPVREAPPLPPSRPSRHLRRRLAMFAALLAALFLGPLRSEVHFRDDAGRLPTPFYVTLRSGDTEKKVLVENGRLRLLRGRWRDLQVTDSFYESTIHPLRGRKMNFEIERNLRLKLKQASTGTPSVPQRGDPDPRDER